MNRIKFDLLLSFSSISSVTLVIPEEKLKKEVGVQKVKEAKVDTKTYVELQQKLLHFLEKLFP